MTRRLLILRPRPDADATAFRASALGLAADIRPLFDIRSLDWEAPAGRFDAIMMTSANAARHGGAALAAYHHLPLYAVGTATAAAAQAAGFADIRERRAGVAALIAGMADDRLSSVLHLTGRDVTPHRDAPFAITRVAVYAAEAIAAPALPETAVALVHSTRAARRLAALIGHRAAFDAVAISADVAEALGSGWRSIARAAMPTDAAMLALAVPLCKD